MNPKTEKHLWPGAQYPIEVAIDRPLSPQTQGIAIIAHPHPLFGGTMNNKVVQTIARAFLQMGYICVRSNFRGVEQSGGTHDNGQGELADLLCITERCLDEILPNTTGQKLALAGFSFGAFVVSHLAQALATKNTTPEKLVLIGTACSRFEVAPVAANSLIIHGETDDTVPLQSVLDWARPQGLPVVVLPGVEHFFHGKLPLLKDLIVRFYPQ
jgi:alpha/beta superfamily hydrolase